MKRMSALVVSVLVIVSVSQLAASAGFMENVPKKCFNRVNKASSYVTVECYVPYVGPLITAKIDAVATASGALAQLTSHVRLSWKTPWGEWKDFISCNSPSGPTGPGFKASVCPGQHLVSPKDGNYLPKLGQQLRCLGWSILHGGTASSMVADLVCTSQKPQVYSDKTFGNLLNTIKALPDDICQRLPDICDG